MTKYRYKELHGANAVRTRELISQGCQAREITILQGSVGKVYIHLLLSHPPSLSPSKIMQYLKGRSSRLYQEQFPELKKKYWGQPMGKGLLLCHSRNGG
ncbi:IS200/IS605 family transposase [Anaerobacillus alkalilacustris]|uniref:IS200/IS605 family transposase n=1 Tax=Anaerobacillus alkalilacustris TaxID=393763 RepID=UPI003CCBDE1C